MKKKYLILLLVIPVFLILGFPLFIYGIDRTFFYSTDPDVVYITNALLYTKYAIISYADHPGTPTITLLYYLFFPLRLIAKYILHMGFIQWSFDNYAVLTYYTRFFELFLTSAGLFIYLNVIKKISNSTRIIMFAAFSVFSFAGLTFATRIVPENLSFFLTSIWLLVFLRFIQKRNYFLNSVLVFIAAFTVANKFTALFLLIPSLFLSIFVRGLEVDQKFVRMQMNILIAGLAFYFGILPASNMFTFIKNWAVLLFSRAGSHGTGAVSTLDWGTYSASAAVLVKAQPAAFIFICLTVVLGVYLLINRKLKFSNPIIFLALTSLAGILVFAKYPVIHYNYVNVLLIIFCASYFLTKVKVSVVKLLLPIMIVLFMITGYKYVITASRDLREKTMESEYSILKAWSPWAADIFGEQLDALNSTKP